MALHAKLQSILFSIAAICWGILPLYLHLNDRLKAYLAPDFRNYALLGGLGVIVLGVFILLTLNSKTGESCCGHEHHDDHHHHNHDCDHKQTHNHDHEHSDHHPLFALAVLFIPLCLSFNYTEDQITDRELMNASAGLTTEAEDLLFANIPPFTRETLERSTPQTDDGHFLIDLIQLYYASGDPEVQKVFTDLSVQTKGQILPEHQRNPNGNRLRLFQVVMTCCAADSAVVPIALEFESTPPNFKNRDWVQVKGQMNYDYEDGVVYPYIKVTDIQPTKKPYEDLFLRGY